jgi:large subunit ribosomal protein L22
MTIKAKLSYLNISPRKVRLVANFIKGMSVKEAENQLSVLRKKASKPLLKLLKSTLANAHHNFKVENEDSLYIKSIQVDQGPTLKRWQPRAFGRAYIIRKRTSHVKLELDVKTGKIEKKESAPVSQPTLQKEETSRHTTKKDSKKKSFLKKKPARQQDKTASSYKGGFFQRKAV